MSDIVETLREESKFAASNPYERCDHEELLKRAADEIERLRNTIAQLRSVASAVSVEGHSYADIRANAKRSPAAEPGEPS
jgi:hypothetical protein